MLEKTLESPLDYKETKSVIPKGNQPKYSLEGQLLKFQYLDHLLWRDNSLEKTLKLGKIEGKRTRGRQRIRWLDGTTNSMDMSLSKLWEMVKDREAWLVQSMGSQSVRQNFRLNWTVTPMFYNQIQGTNFITRRLASLPGPGFNHQGVGNSPRVFWTITLPNSELV